MKCTERGISTPVLRWLLMASASPDRSARTCVYRHACGAGCPQNGRVERPPYFRGLSGFHGTPGVRYSTRSVHPTQGATMRRFTEDPVLATVNVLGTPLFIAATIAAGAVLAVGVAFIGTVGRLFH